MGDRRDQASSPPLITVRRCSRRQWWRWSGCAAHRR
jgi:hypothetical protein